MKLKYQAIIEQMSLFEKASLMAGKNFWQTQDIEKYNIPSICLSDGPHGLRRQKELNDPSGKKGSLPATCFPTASALANSWDEELLQNIGKALAEEAIDQDVNMILGPGINIKRSPLCGRNFEYYSEDPFLAGKLGASLIKGIQEKGVASCVKHFACNNQENNRMTLDSVVDERTLRENYLTAFEIAIKEGNPKCVMSSYNLVNGTYANENPHLLKDILRDEWNYKGLVVTDWGGNNVRIEGLKCFNSLEMPFNAGDTTEEIISAINNHELDETILDQNVDILLNTVFELSKEKVKQVVDYDKHHLLAQKACEESIVLLENKNDVLPIKENEKVAFIGDFIFTPRYQGAGSSIVNPKHLETVNEKLKSSNLNIVGLERGFNRYGKSNKKLLKRALNVSKNADKIVLFLGLDEYSETEGSDRINASLKNNQLKLVDELSKLNKPIIVILSTGSMVELPFVDKIDGLILLSLSGEAGASAILNVLNGKVNPSGKLSETYPYLLKDHVTYENYPSKNHVALYKEAYGIGYRYFDKANVKIRYPFGYGLSYTSFAYSDFKINKTGVTFKLKNIGDVKGKEIVELYVGLKKSNLIRPTKELKGFKKIELDPNEETNVEILFDDRTFRYFNVKTNQWEIEEGEYDIYISSSINDTKLKGTIFINGTTKEFPYDINEFLDYKSGTLSRVSNEEFKLLLGHEIPDGNIKFINKKQNRILVNYNTTVAELKYSKRWVGRFTLFIINSMIFFYKLFGNKDMANMINMGIKNQPIRSLSRYSSGSLHFTQLDGLIMMFNGHFFKGMKKFLKEGKRYKKLK